MKHPLNPSSNARSLAALVLLALSVNGAMACSANISQEQIKKADTKLDLNQPKDAFAMIYPLSQHGSGGAHHYLSRMYEQGQGVKKSPFMVRHLNWMGAQENDPVSMYRTGLDFFERGHAKDGEYWMGRAKDCGNTDALQYLLERRVKQGNQEEARVLLDAGIATSLPAFKFTLAEQYEKGALGFAKDPQLAFRWYYTAALDGMPKAMAAVAYFFARGLHGVHDDTAAIAWYHKAARAGHVESMTAYAWMLASGKGAPADKEEAEYYFQKAVTLGDQNAEQVRAQLFNGSLR